MLRMNRSPATTRRPRRALTLTGVALLTATAVTAPCLRAQEPAPPPAHTRMTLGGPPPAVRTEADLKAFLDDLESQQFAINTALGVETYYQWRGETTHRAAATNALANDLLNRRDYASIVNAWQGKVADSALARRVALHARAFMQAKAGPRLVIALSNLQSAIQDSIEKFRYTFGGQRYTSTALVEIADTSGDRERRRGAFMALNQRTPVIAASVVHANDAQRQHRAAGRVRQWRGRRPRALESQPRPGAPRPRCIRARDAPRLPRHARPRPY